MCLWWLNVESMRDNTAGCYLLFSALEKLGQETRFGWFLRWTGNGGGGWEGTAVDLWICTNTDARLQTGWLNKSVFVVIVWCSTKSSPNTPVYHIRSLNWSGQLRNSNKLLVTQGCNGAVPMHLCSECNFHLTTITIWSFYAKLPSLKRAGS